MTTSQKNSDKYLVIFDEKYLREDIQKAPFKYGGEVNLVGYATNTTHVNKISSFFSGPSDMINSILKSLFETSDDLFIGKRQTRRLSIF